MTTVEGGAVPNDLLSPSDLAGRWKVTTGHLRNLRYQRRGVQFIKLGGTIAYRFEDVLAYEEARLVQTSVPNLN